MTVLFSQLRDAHPSVEHPVDIFAMSELESKAKHHKLSRGATNAHSLQSNHKLSTNPPLANWNHPRDLKCNVIRVISDSKCDPSGVFSRVSVIGREEIEIHRPNEPHRQSRIPSWNDKISGSDRLNMLLLLVRCVVRHRADWKNGQNQSICSALPRQGGLWKRKQIISFLDGI
jgi:hypothetical protein